MPDHRGMRSERVVWGMDRRAFLRTTPALAAAVTVGASVPDAGASGPSGSAEVSLGGSGSPGGFRLLSERDRPGVLYTAYPVREYVVECPYPVGSRAWMAISDRDKKGAVVVSDELGGASWVRRPRRVIFPRLTAEDFPDGEGIEDRFAAVYRAVKEGGFDSVRGEDHEWRVVHVEYRCPDGVEHIVAGLPASWDPRLCLSMMVKAQIGGMAPVATPVGFREFTLETDSDRREVAYQVIVDTPPGQTPTLQGVPWRDPEPRFAENLGGGRHRARVSVPSDAEPGRYRVGWLGTPQAWELIGTTNFEVV